MHFVDRAKTIITLSHCFKDQKMLGLETNFERTRPIPHQLETKTMSLSSRQHEIGNETENVLCRRRNQKLFKEGTPNFDIFSSVVFSGRFNMKQVEEQN